MYRQVAAAIIGKDDKYLLVKKPRKDHAWQFPQGGVDEGETHLSAAYRELREECGETLAVDFLNTEIGRYKYDFPQEFDRHDKGVIGAEVVFFKGGYVSGTVELDQNEVVDFQWCTKDEIQQKVDLEYWEVVKEWI